MTTGRINQVTIVSAGPNTPRPAPELSAAPPKKGHQRSHRRLKFVGCLGNTGRSNAEPALKGAPKRRYPWIAPSVACFTFNTPLRRSLVATDGYH